MKKLLALTLVLCLILSVGVSAFAAPKKVTLSLGLTSAAEDLATQSFERFAKNVEEKSDGSIVINVFPASQLGDAVAQMESMITGAQDMFAEGELNYEADHGVPELKAQSYGCVNTNEKLRTFLASSVYKEWNEKFRQVNGVVTIANNWIRTPVVMALREPLTTMEQFKGVKLRTVPSESTITAYSALGFNPTAVAYNEVYLSLSQGVIDGTICPFEGAYSMKFYEQAPYILKVGTAVTNNALWVNEAKWNSLTDEQRAIITECAVEAGDWYSEQIQETIKEYVAAMEAGGATIIEPSEELLQQVDEALGKAAQQSIADGKLDGDAYQKMHDAALGLID